MYGIVSTGSNDTMMIFGVVACVSLPLIGLFDETFGGIHVGIAAVFFGAQFLYQHWLTTELQNHKDKFPE